jgi:hypothetical protein
MWLHMSSFHRKPNLPDLGHDLLRLTVVGQTSPDSQRMNDPIQLQKMQRRQGHTVLIL